MQQIVTLIFPGHWMTVLDLQDGYLHILIPLDCQQFFRFCFQGFHW